MAAEDIDIGEKIASVPVGKLIYEVAMGIAKAQWELNKASIVSAEMMSGSRIVRDLDTGAPLVDASGKLQRQDTRVYFGYTNKLDPQTKDLVRDPQLVSMLELGFTPTFYQFVDTVIEVKVDIKICKERKNTSSSSDKNSGSVAVATTVDATYSQTYNYSAEGSSLVRTKLVPVPPPPVLEERIRQVMNAENDVQRFFQNQMNALVEKREHTPEPQRGALDAEIGKLNAGAVKAGAEVTIPRELGTSVDFNTRLVELLDARRALFKIQTEQNKPGSNVADGEKARTTTALGDNATSITELVEKAREKGVTLTRETDDELKRALS